MAEHHGGYRDGDRVIYSRSDSHEVSGTVDSTIDDVTWMNGRFVPVRFDDQSEMHDVGIAPRVLRLDNTPIRTRDHEGLVV